MGSDFNATPVTESWLYNPVFPAHWKRSPLYALANWVNGLAFRNIHFSPTGKPVIKIAEIKGGITGQTKFTTQTFDESVYITNGDMLFSWSGQPETSIDAFWWRGPDGWLNQHIFKVTPKPEIDRTFFFYLLRYLKPNFVGIARNKQTTGLGHVTKRDLEQINAAFPEEISEQRAIACILGALDNKIELNRRMNETLEEMARAIFKSWFVDFDPVRAKAEGRQPPGLAPHIADLFPDAFEESNLGEIPKGWRVGTLGSVSEKAQYGYTATATDEPVGPRFLRIKDINKQDWIEWHNVPYCEIEEQKLDRYRLSKGDVVIARMADPGHGALIEEDIDAVFASYLIRFRPIRPELGRFLQYWLRSETYWNLVISRQSGTTRANLNAQVLSSFPLVVPDDKILKVFSNQTDALRNKLVANVNESRTLAALRDTLLPKLISGELRVPDAERIVGRAI